ncbi:Hsp70 family protein [Aminithiophilus ramosus]|nr:Hsp70 family protein [Aminithiophilus ramosus]
MDETMLGIDLGTRYALTALCGDDGRPLVLPNRWGGKRTPSVVALTEKGWLAGEEAARVALLRPDRAWWNVKRRIGSGWTARCDGRSYSPEELLVPLLRLLREDAEALLGRYVASCVLALPAHFSFAEREALSGAARRAGFETTLLVNEPTAAALATESAGRHLVLDFGAGTVDLSVVEVEEGVWQILESRGRSDLGGADVDRLLAEDLFRRCGYGAEENDPRWPLLLAEAETIKIVLSEAQSCPWHVPAGLFPDASSPVEVTREELERLASPLLEEIVALTEDLWRRHRPETLLLVGGSSRIPLLRKLLEKRGMKAGHLRLCPDEAVVCGAALRGLPRKKERLLLDVLSEGLGIRTADGAVALLLERGTPLPASARRRFVATGGGRIHVEVLQASREGERSLGNLSVSPLARGDEVEIAFRVDGGGSLHVEVRRGEERMWRVLTLGGEREDPVEAFLRDRERLERKLALLTGLLDAGSQQRVRLLVDKTHLLPGDDAAIGKEALAALDLLVSTLEREVVS